MQRAAPTDVHLVLDKYLSLALRAPLSLLRCFPLLSNSPRLSLQIFLSAVSATFIFLQVLAADFCDWLAAPPLNFTQKSQISVYMLDIRNLATWEL